METAIALRSGEKSTFQLFETGTVDANYNPEERVAYLTKKMQLADELGLDAQVKILKREIVTEEKIQLTVPPMSPEEVAIWRAFLPTSYGSGYGNYSRNIGDYSFDRIPLPVLERWNQTKQERIYDSFEIWTPEKLEVVDPILVGTIGPRYYMLARWAESDANLVSIDTIKKKLFATWLVENWWGVLIGIAIFFAAGTGIGLGAVRLLSTSLLIGLTGAAGFVGIMSIFVRVSWKHNSLMQAIRRHNKAKK